MKTQSRLKNIFNTQKKFVRRKKLARSLGIEFSSSKLGRLRKTGWSCNCFLCKPPIKKKLKHRKDCEDY